MPLPNSLSDAVSATPVASALVYAQRSAFSAATTDSLLWIAGVLALVGLVCVYDSVFAALRRMVFRRTFEKHKRQLI